jgi:putative FmdB family regulatory protein
MPIYEYLCETCGKKFEVLQKFSDEPLQIHEDCGGKLEKLISTSALQFKGSGWYVNDYAKGKTANKPGETKVDGKSDSGKSDSGGEAKSETKAESKSETKTEAKPAASESKPAASTTTSDSK